MSFSLNAAIVVSGLVRYVSTNSFVGFGLCTRYFLLNMRKGLNH